MWNLSMCFCLLLASWRSCSAFYVPQVEVDRPNGELKSMLNQLMVDVKKIIDVVETNSNNEQFVNLETLNSRLANFQYLHMDTIQRIAVKQREMDKLIQLRTEKFQSELSANVAAVEDLKDQLAKLVADQDEQSHLVYEAVPEPEKDENTLDPLWVRIPVAIQDKEVEDDESKSNSVENDWLSEDDKDFFSKVLESETSEHLPELSSNEWYSDVIDVANYYDE